MQRRPVKSKGPVMSWGTFTAAAVLIGWSPTKSDGPMTSLWTHLQQQWYSGRRNPTKSEVPGAVKKITAAAVVTAAAVAMIRWSPVTPTCLMTSRWTPLQQQLWWQGICLSHWPQQICHFYSTWSALSILHNCPNRSLRSPTLRNNGLLSSKEFIRCN